jgi:SAM-dependent methyltransferase
MRIELGCGLRKQQGYIGLDCVPLPGVDVVCNLEQGIPLAKNSATDLHADHCIEHLPDIVFAFQEIYRVCKPGARVHIRVPYYASIGAFKDPTHKSFYTEETFRYFTSHEWEGFDYQMEINLQIEAVSYVYLPGFHFMSHVMPKFVMTFLRRFLWNVVHTLIVEMRVIKDVEQKE